MITDSNGDCYNKDEISIIDDAKNNDNDFDDENEEDNNNENDDYSDDESDNCKQEQS